MDSITKICTQCGETKKYPEFYRDKNRPDGLRSCCKDCSETYNKEYRKTHPLSGEVLDRKRERNRKYHKTHRNRSKRIASVYGISQEELELMKQRQNGFCEICQSAGKLVVDHDHSNGRVRGLLCHGCNVALGFMKDNPLVLESAVRYLRANIVEKEEIK